MKNGHAEGGNWEDENESSGSSWKPPTKIQGLGNKDLKTKGSGEQVYWLVKQESNRQPEKQTSLDLTIS